MAHFNLPEYEDEVTARELRAKVKKQTLQKMAELFWVWKKKLRECSLSGPGAKFGNSTEVGG
jgi:hypothetical protein